MSKFKLKTNPNYVNFTSKLIPAGGILVLPDDVEEDVIITTTTNNPYDGSNIKDKAISGVIVKIVDELIPEGFKEELTVGTRILLNKKLSVFLNEDTVTNTLILTNYTAVLAILDKDLIVEI